MDSKNAIPGVFANRAVLLSLKLLIMLAAPGPGWSNDVYVHRNANGTLTFSDSPLIDGHLKRHTYTSITRIPTTANPCRGYTRHQLNLKGQALEPLFNQAAQVHSLDPLLIKAVARAESCFNRLAVSRAGAQGLMQLMPTTAASMGVNNSFHIEENIMGGAKYLALMLRRYENNVELALAAYNAGPGNVDKYGGVPPFKETRHYIKTVSEFHRQYLGNRNEEPTS